MVNKCSVYAPECWCWVSVVGWGGWGEVVWSCFRVKPNCIWGWTGLWLSWGFDNYSIVQGQNCNTAFLGGNHLCMNLYACFWLSVPKNVRFSVPPRWLEQQESGALIYGDTGTMDHFDTETMGKCGCGCHLPQPCCDFFTLFAPGTVPN